MPEQGELLKIGAAAANAYPNAGGDPMATIIVAAAESATRGPHNVHRRHHARQCPQPAPPPA
ncbi:MAG TPA: hypothetical protein VKG25_16915 [Bryobacteraceae bacterium]|nr:hypothetical protein [Bryobacteraceae bacterium]